ncbi:peptidyl-prolyl cis-trans isomerase C [Poseidonocella pacifica]|uniref:Parvulin-like PPIase n=1 Tax=Poseidonocella pacifica TaxID=871651 RepID=A0A1I0YFX3_9RHOB|nr:peptidylprolyl isomerase [Poseidonocella pacifica]SFB11747.1 peptidyl-prolyl cis-trans isomerase C [Poseidonocella pacifica]
MNFPRSLTAALLSATLLSTAVSAQDEQSEAPDANTVVAKVGETEITLGHMVLLHARLPDQYRELPGNVLFQGILDQLVQQALLAQTFEGDQPAFVKFSLENEERSMLANEVAERIIGEALTVEAIEAAYQSEYVANGAAPEYNASHILLETEEEAQQVREELDGGAQFAEVARARSTGPSGPNGGSLGWFGNGAMVEPFQEAVKALAPGEIGGPIQTQFGWHVIMLNETRTSDVPPLESVRANIMEKLRQEALQKGLDELRESTEVTTEAAEGIDPALITDYSLVDN